MKKAAEYHQHAEECRAMAERSNSPEHKAALLSMALTWENLGKDRAAHVARRERIAGLTEIE